MITKSAKRAYKKSLKRQARNLKHKKNLQKVIKAFKNLIAAKKINEGKEQLSKVYKFLDKSTKTGFIKKNKASRLKSRLTKLLNKK